MQGGQESMKIGSFCRKNFELGGATNDMYDARHGRESKKNRDGAVNCNFVGLLGMPETYSFFRQNSWIP